jgi:hypothetical protein
LEKFLRSHHVVLIHPNNYHLPTGRSAIAGIHLLPEDRATFFDKALTFPHPLDSKNVQERSDVVLPECWYKP